MKRIILTGGGTAGHVTPNIALVPKLKEKGYDIQYIGSYDGIERKLIEDLKISYYGIASGKLRRYFDIKNFSDPFRVIKGYGQAVRLIEKTKAQRCLFQRRLRGSSRCHGSEALSYSGRDP